MKSAMGHNCTNELDHHGAICSSLYYPLAVNAYQVAKVGVTEAYDKLNIACRGSLKNNLDYLIVKSTIEEDSAFNKASEEIKEALVESQKKAVEVACRASVKKTLAYRLLQHASNETKEHPSLYKAAYKAKQYMKTTYMKSVYKTSVANKKISVYRDTVKDAISQELHACHVAKKADVMVVQESDEAIEKIKAVITEADNIVYKEEIEGAYREADLASMEATCAGEEFKSAITDAIVLADKTVYKEAFESSIEPYQAVLISVEDEIDEFRSFHKNCVISENTILYDNKLYRAVNNTEVNTLYMVARKAADEVDEVTEEVIEEFKSAITDAIAVADKIADKPYKEEVFLEINTLYKESSDEVYKIASKAIQEATDEAIK